MIKQLLNLAIAKYRDLSVASRSIICRCRRQRQIIDLRATDKSRYFAQPRPIIVYYLFCLANFIWKKICWSLAFFLINEYRSPDSGRIIVNKLRSREWARHKQINLNSKLTKLLPRAFYHWSGARIC